MSTLPSAIPEPPVDRLCEFNKASGGMVDVEPSTAVVEVAASVSSAVDDAGVDRRLVDERAGLADAAELEVRCDCRKCRPEQDWLIEAEREAINRLRFALDEIQVFHLPKVREIVMLARQTIDDWCMATRLAAHGHDCYFRESTAKSFLKRTIDKISEAAAAFKGEIRHVPEHNLVRKIIATGINLLETALRSVDGFDEQVGVLAELGGFLLDYGALQRCLPENYPGVSRNGDMPELHMSGEGGLPLLLIHCLPELFPAERLSDAVGLRSTGTFASEREDSRRLPRDLLTLKEFSLSGPPFPSEQGKITLKMHNRLALFVGPHGSGKTAILDALTSLSEYVIHSSSSARPMKAVFNIPESAIADEWSAQLEIRRVLHLLHSVAAPPSCFSKQAHNYFLLMFRRLKRIAHVTRWQLHIHSVSPHFIGLVSKTCSFGLRLSMRDGEDPFQLLRRAGLHSDHPFIKRYDEALEHALRPWVEVCREDAELLARRGKDMLMEKQAQGHASWLGCDSSSSKPMIDMVLDRVLPAMVRLAICKLSQDRGADWSTEATRLSSLPTHLHTTFAPADPSNIPRPPLVAQLADSLLAARKFSTLSPELILERLHQAGCRCIELPERQQFERVRHQLLVATEFDLVANVSETSVLESIALYRGKVEHQWRAVWGALSKRIDKAPEQQWMMGKFLQAANGDISAIVKGGFPSPEERELLWQNGVQLPDRRLEASSSSASPPRLQLVDTRQGQHIRVDPNMAPGFVKSWLTVLFAVEFGSVVALDEPETHMRPDSAQQIIAYILRSLNERPGLSVLIATHSTALIQESLLESVSSVRRFHVLNLRSQLDKAPDGLGGARLSQRLLWRELLFADRVLLVEGPNDARLFRAIQDVIHHRLSIRTTVTGDRYQSCDEFKLPFSDAQARSLVNTAIVELGSCAEKAPIQFCRVLQLPTWALYDADVLQKGMIFQTLKSVLPENCAKTEEVLESNGILVWTGEMEDIFSENVAVQNVLKQHFPRINSSKEWEKFFTAKKAPCCLHQDWKIIPHATLLNLVTCMFLSETHGANEFRRVLKKIATEPAEAFLADQRKTRLGACEAPLSERHGITMRQDSDASESNPTSESQAWVLKNAWLYGLKGTYKSFATTRIKLDSWDDRCISTILFSLDKLCEAELPPLSDAPTCVATWYLRRISKLYDRPTKQRDNDFERLALLVSVAIVCSKIVQLVDDDKEVGWERFLSTEVVTSLLCCKSFQRQQNGDVGRLVDLLSRILFFTGDMLDQDHAWASESKHFKWWAVFKSAPLKCLRIRVQF